MLRMNHLVGFGVLLQGEPPPPPASYEFNLTAENISGTSTFTGYDSAGMFGTPGGSIDAEPIAGNTLIACMTGNPSEYGFGAVVVFSGDTTSLLSGKTIYIDSVSWGAPYTDWFFEDGNTSAYWASVPVFVNGLTYFVEIK